MAGWLGLAKERKDRGGLLFFNVSYPYHPRIQCYIDNIMVSNNCQITSLQKNSEVHAINNVCGLHNKPTMMISNITDRSPF